VVIVSFISILSSGCAFNQGHVAYSGAGYKGVSAFRGLAYVPVQDFCERYNFECSIDTISKVAEIRHGGTSVKVLPDSNVALINGYTKKFSPRTKIKDDEVQIPASLVKYLERTVFKKAIEIPPTKIPTIKRIVIDPGHGGKDPGAMGRKGLREKDVVLDVAKRLKNELLKRGNFKVIMTRKKDKFISLGGRSRIANSAKADLFISVHANASRSRRVKGFEVYYLSNATNDMARAIAAAENEALAFENNVDSGQPSQIDPTVWDMKLQEFRDESKELARFICDTSSRRLGVKNRGIKSARFYVLKGTHMPSVLIEVGFISNREEESNLRSSSYRQKVAKGIAEGILVYKKKFEKTKGFTKNTY